ncbi:MICOS complex subunit MIC60 [Kushneria sp. AK178]
MWNLLLGGLGKIPVRVLIALAALALLAGGLWGYTQRLEQWREALADAREEARSAHEQAQRQQLVARAWQAHAEHLAEVSVSREQQLETDRQSLTGKRQHLERIINDHQTSKEWADHAVPDGIHQWMCQLSAADDAGDGAATADAPPSDTAPAGTGGDQRRSHQSGSGHAADGLRTASTTHEH